jgi:tRNA (guanine-N7-)-methyltransferase
VSKGKLEKFAELKTYSHVVQPPFEEVFNKDYKLKGKWQSFFFNNRNPITLELGCGKGEYTVGLAKRFKERNFLGIDIKGSRIWKGAKESHEQKLSNVGFIRTRIDHITSFFSQQDSVEEIWITFPDPQLKKPYKRLTSSRFLNRYLQFAVNGAIINLKTDNEVLYHYTKQLAEYNNLKIEAATDNVYQSEYLNDILSIRTFYEEGWLNEGLRSHYIRFKLDNEKHIEEPPEPDQ